MGKKGYLMVISLLFLFILIAGCQSQTPTGKAIIKKAKPDLRVDKDWEISVSLGKGFYGAFEGVVTNFGDATARNVEVRCTVKRDGKVIGSEETYIGDLRPKSNQLFEMEVDFSGGDEATGYCKADCDNC